MDCSEVILSKGNYMSERALKTFLGGGRRLGVPLAVCYAIGSTILRNGLSINALLTADFLRLFVIAAVVGFLLAGAWELLLEVLLQRYEHNRSMGEQPLTWLRFMLVEGGLRFGVPGGFFVDFIKTFGRHGISSDFLLWQEFLFWLGFDVVLFFLVGCAFGLFMLGSLKMLRPPVGSRSD
jgi:hypothetical protein